MTRNPYNDNTEVLRAAELNALANAFDLELVLSGCTPSKGTGDFDVDVASGTIIVAGGEVSVGSQTVTLTSPANDADYDTDEERVDLVTIDSAGTASATEGTPAGNPNSPDIPADEVLVARVHTLHSDTSLAASDIFDARVLFGFADYPLANADVANDLFWTEDANSPWSLSGAASYQQTLSGTYDEVRIHIHDPDNATTNADALQLQLNGDTATNYTEREADGGVETSKSAFDIANIDGGDEPGLVVVAGAGRWTNRANMARVAGDSGPGLMQYGQNPTITSPLDTFTLLSGGNNFSADVELFGRDVG